MPADLWEGRARAAVAVVHSQIAFFKAHFGRVESQWKSDHSRVTEADLTISQRTFELLGAQFAQDDFCSEETSPDAQAMALNARYAWVLDPIDGTNNYAIGFPNCCIALALLCEGMPVFGVIYDFSRDEILFGGKATGLFCGQTPRFGKRAVLKPQSLLGIQLPMRPDLVERLMPLLTVYRLRSIGSTALNLAHAAAGQLDGAFGRAYVWDFAAGIALIEAGGGKVYFDRPSIFPLKQFHPSGPCVAYYGGSPEFCATVQDLGFGAYPLS